MAVSIGALRYDIIADTEQFEKAMVTTRQEQRQANKVMKEAQTPVDRLNKEIDQLNNLRRKGAIDARAYGKAVKKATAETKQAIKEASRYGKAMSKLSSSFKGMAATVAAGFSMNAIFGSVQEQATRIDQTQKFADLIGATANELVTLRIAGADTAGMLSGQVDVAVQRFQRRLGQAQQGAGEAVKVLKRLRLDPNQLAALPMIDALKAVGAAIDGVKSKNEQLAIAMALFDTEGVPMLEAIRDGAIGVDNAFKKARTSGLLFTKDQAKEMAELNDQVSDLKRSWDGLVSAGTKLSAGPLTKILNLLEQTLRDIRGEKRASDTSTTSNVQNMTDEELRNVKTGSKKEYEAVRLERERREALAKTNKEMKADERNRKLAAASAVGPAFPISGTGRIGAPDVKVDEMFGDMSNVGDAFKGVAVAAHQAAVEQKLEEQKQEAVETNRLLIQWLIQTGDTQGI